MRVGVGVGVGFGRGGFGAGVGGGVTIPAAITSGMWTLSDYPSVDGNKLTVDLDAAPADGGSALLYYEFRVDPGAWQLLPGGTALGPRQITVLTEAPAAVQLQAVNAVDATPDNPSDTKIETPTALAGPTNSVAPAITGIIAVGETATRSNGTWSVTPDEYETEWYYGATLLAGETASTYAIDDFTFGTVLSCRVRVRQTAGAWSDWVNATGGGTVEANAQDVVWEAEYLSYDPANPRTETTPAVTAGDCILFLVKAAAGSISSTFVQGDFNLGTLREATTTDNGEALALVTYVCPTSEGGGLNFSAGIASTPGAELSIVALNIGPHIYNESDKASYSDSAPFNFPAVASERNGKVFYGLGFRNGGPTHSASPSPPSKATATPYSAGGTFDNGDASTLWCFIRTVTSPGTVAAQQVTPSGYSFNKHIVASFTPQIVAPSVPAGKYIDDDNGAGIIRTSTISSMITDGVTINLSASRKVGNYLTNNLSLGTLVAFDAGSGVPISSHDGDVMWINPQPIITLDGDGQPFVNEVGMQGPPYDAGLAATTPVTVYAGDVVVISVNQSVDAVGSYVQKYAFLHIVDTLPYDDELAPPHTWHASLGARPRFRFSDWNQGTKPLTTHAVQSNAPSLAVAAQVFSRRSFSLVNDWNSYAISASLHPKNYGRDLIDPEKDALTIIGADYTLEQKMPFLLGYWQRGIDDWGVYKSGKAANAASIWHAADGGQKSGRKLSIIFAGHMLGVNAMRDVDSTAAAADFQEDGMMMYVTQDLIDFTQDPGWDGTDYTDSTGRPYEAYVQGMLNGNSLNYPMPEWCGQIYDPDAGYAFTLAKFNAHWNGHAYRHNGNQTYSVAEVLLAASMGLDAYWGNDAWFDYIRRHYEMQRNGVDPWRLAGGGVNRYPMVTTTGAEAYFNIGAPSSTSTGWAERMYAAHIDSVWPYPWA